MCPFGELSNKELRAQLDDLQTRSGNTLRAQRLQHELQVHQIELEMQNRELREAEHKLEVARDRYADLYDFAPVGYLTLDPKGYVRELNLTAAGMLGMERVHIVGQPFAAWLLAGESRAFFEHLSTVAQGVERRVTELRLKQKGGEPLTVRVESIPEPGGAGVCRMVMMDITEAKRNELIERERAVELAHLARVSTLGAMASTIAHEISQPLSAIVGYATVGAHSMKRSPQNHASALEALEKIASIARQAGEIVHSISNFSRKGEALQQAMDLNDVVRDAVRLLLSPARSANTEVTLDLAENLPHVMGNGVQLEQVIVNVVMNAIEAIKTQGGDVRSVCVRTALVEGAVQLSVTDTGCGLTPEAAARMFEPFFSTKPDGHGIGLALCRTIIRSHGGRIWATPNPIGGATVAFNLPMLREPSSTP